MGSVISRDVTLAPLSRNLLTFTGQLVTSPDTLQQTTALISAFLGERESAVSQSCVLHYRVYCAIYSLRPSLHFNRAVSCYCVYIISLSLAQSLAYLYLKRVPLTPSHSHRRRRGEHHGRRHAPALRHTPVRAPRQRSASEHGPPCGPYATSRRGNIRGIAVPRAPLQHHCRRFDECDR